LLVLKGHKIYDEPSLYILEKIINDITRAKGTTPIPIFFVEGFSIEIGSIEEAIVGSSSHV
jgi:hypothetical protein